MKRFEQFNQLFNTNENVEEQAIGMIIAYIGERYNIEIDDIESLKKRYYGNIKWLNEEVE